MYTVFDLETTIHNRGEDAVGNMQASPHHPDNRIVLGGYKRQGNGSVTVLKGSKTDWTYMLNRTDLLVGQNIKFDLMHLRKLVGDECYYDWIKRGGTIWDTMQAEYLITGQQKQFASLDDMAKKYGGELKDDRIKEYWDNGVDTEDIPTEELEPYLVGDVLNTEIVYLAQRKKIQQLGMKSLMESQNDAILCTTDIEYVGMKHDYAKSRELSSKLTAQAEELAPEITKYFEDFLGKQDKEINPNSSQQLSKVLFGGSYKRRIDTPMLDDNGNRILFKTGPRKGQVRTKKQEVVEYTQGLGLTPADGTETKNKGIYSTDDEALKQIEHPLVELILKQRALLKDVSTYYNGFCDATWPTDGCIHGNLNHCSTVTGRLSSSAPNCQNLSAKERD